MIKFPLFFIWPTVYIIYRREFIKMPDCVKTLGPACRVSGDWLQCVLRLSRAAWRRYFSSWPERWVGCHKERRGGSPRRRSSNLRPRSWRQQWGGGWWTWIWSSEARRAWQGTRVVEQAEAQRVLPCWALSRNTPECMEVISYIFSNGKRLEIISMFHQLCTG